MDRFDDIILENLYQECLDPSQNISTVDRAMGIYLIYLICDETEMYLMYVICNETGIYLIYAIPGMWLNGVASDPSDVRNL